MIKIYLFSLFLTIYSSYCFASAKDNIISNLKSIENISFSFEQTINEKSEKGICGGIDRELQNKFHK